MFAHPTIQAIMEGSPSGNEIPLWQAINTDFTLLEELATVSYLKLLNALCEDSRVFSNRPTSERVEALSEGLDRLQQLKSEINAIVDRIRDNLVVYVLAEEMSQDELAKLLSPQAMAAYYYHAASVQNKWTFSKPLTADPYAHYTKLSRTIDQKMNWVLLKRQHYQWLASSSNIN